MQSKLPGKCETAAALTRARVAVFDSGIGGLSVLRAIRDRLPAVPVLYLADQVHLPYGGRPAAEVRGFAAGITRFFLARHVELVVVACNTASAAALQDLRAMFPQIPFVGMEPAIKPAAAGTRTRKVGVLATPTTLKGRLYAQTVARFAQGVVVFQDPCPGLVEQIELGEAAGPRCRDILAAALKPMLEADVDTVVLGCTHYPFVRALVCELAGPGVQVIDPAPAVARQVERMLAVHAGTKVILDVPVTQLGGARFFTSGSAANFARQLHQLLGISEGVQGVTWNGQEVAEVGALTDVPAIGT